MSAGFVTRCTMADPVVCVWESGHAPSLLIAVRRLVWHRDEAHAWGEPWRFSYSDPATGEVREVAA